MRLFLPSLVDSLLSLHSSVAREKSFPFKRILCTNNCIAKRDRWEAAAATVTEGTLPRIVSDVHWTTYRARGIMLRFHGKAFPFVSSASFEESWYSSHSWVSHSFLCRCHSKRPINAPMSFRRLEIVSDRFRFEALSCCYTIKSHKPPGNDNKINELVQPSWEENGCRFDLMWLHT